MPQAYLPDNRFRSPTAVQNMADRRMDHVYSAVVLGHGGTGTQTIFVNPKGQPIPQMVGSGITVTAEWQTVYSDVTTNLDKAGELGSTFGEVGIRGIGLTLEQAPYAPDTSVGANGVTPFEVAEISRKVAFEFRVSGKRQISGPVWSFPAMGGAFGSLSVAVYGTSQMSTQGIVNNGPMSSGGKRLRIPILAARTDTIAGLVSVPRGTLTFRTNTGQGASSLMWCLLDVVVNGDVR